MLISNWLSSFCVRSKYRSQMALRQPRLRRGQPGAFDVPRLEAAVEHLEPRQLLSAITVDVGGDTHQSGHTTLREAVALANTDNSGDTISFANALAGQTITLTQGELLLTGSMTIAGPGASQLAVDGNNASRVFNVSGGSTQVVTISGLTIQHGKNVAPADGLGGAVFNSRNLTLSNDVITGSTSQTGGAVLNYGFSTQPVLTLMNDTFTGNAADSGAGVYNQHGSVTSTGNTYSGNVSSGGYGGGLVNNFGTYVSTNDTYVGNSVTGSGGRSGAVYNHGTLTLTNDTISGNSATNSGSGGGLYNETGSGLNVVDTIIVGNKQSSGGDIFGATISATANLTSIPVGKTLANILQTDNSGNPVLANHSGPTPTIALAVGSSAIGGGVAIATVTASGDGTTSLNLDTSAFLTVGDLLKIGTEIVRVTGISTASTATINVARAQAGTSQANLNGLAATLAYDQRGVLRTTNGQGAYFRGTTSSIIVTTGGDVHVAGKTTLREAIQIANGDSSGDSITFDSSLAGQTITLTQGELPVTGSMTIDGGGTIVVDGNNASRIFNINDGASGATENVTISGLTLQHGNSTDGAAIINAENLTLSTNTISASAASDLGGGIRNDGTVTSTNNTFSGNSAAGNAGGIENYGAFNSIGDTVSGNTSGNYSGGIDNNGTFTATNDTISGNSAVQGAGGIGNGVKAVFTSTNNTVSGNWDTGSASQGGGINAAPQSVFNALNTIVVGNYRAGTNNVADDLAGNFTAASSHNQVGGALSGVLRTGGSGPVGFNPLLAFNAGGRKTIALTNSNLNPALGTAAALTTITVGLTASATSATVASSTYLAVGDLLRIDSEIVQVTGISGTSITVQRGVAGTTAAAHNINAPVLMAIDQRGLLRVTNDMGAVHGPQASIVVTRGDDIPTIGYTILRQAVLEANADVSGDTITFASGLSGTTITLTRGELPVSGSMTINGGGTIAVDGNGATRIFNISDGSSSTAQNVTITGLTLQHGNVNGGGVNGDGGAVYSEENLTLNNDTFTANSAMQGGALFNNNGTMTLNGNLVSGNTATGFGGGIDNVGTLIMFGNTITGNASASNGGGLLNYAGSVLSTNDTIVGNTAVSSAGGIANNSNSTVTTVNDTIAGNSTSGNGSVGGGIQNLGTLNSANTLVVGNTSNGAANDVSGSVSATSINNLFGIPNGKTLSNVLQTVSGSNPLKPQLANNGGRNATVALVPGSPAAAAGAALAHVTSSGDGNTTLTVDTSLFLTPNELLKIGTEVVRVTGITSANSITVVRAQAGTSQIGLGGLSVGLATDERGSARNAIPDLGAYETLAPTVANVTINGGVYNGNAYAVTNATATGANNRSLAKFGDATLSYLYYAGTLAASDLAGASPLSGPPIHAGAYTVVAVYASNVVGYRNGVSLPVHFSITPATLKISAVTNSKTYDATSGAAATPTFTGTVGTDTVTGLMEAYESKDVKGANGSLLDVTQYTVKGGNGGNDYTVTLAKAAGTIGAAALSISAATNSKVYDGTASAAAAPIVNGLKGQDTVTGQTESYLSKDVLGTLKSTLKINGNYTVNDGNGGKDYIVTLGSQTAAGTITAAALTITASANTKVYDGTVSAAAIPVASGLSGADTVTGLTESYTSKDVKGIGGSTLNVDTGYTVNDNNGGNDYSVTLVSTAGTITPAGLTVNATTTTKVYDATTATTVLPTVSGLKSGDTATNLSEAFASKDVLGTNGSTLNVATASINDGNGGNDYIVTLNSFPGTITPAVLTISAATNTKVYDGSTSASATPTVSGLNGSDMISGLTESYLSKDVLGTNQSILQIGASYTISDGNGGNDYSVTTNSATGSITGAGLTINATTVSRVYDGTTATTALPSVSGLKAGDTVTGLVEAYLSKDVKGTNGSTLAVTGSTINDGNSGNDYIVTLNTIPGTITPAALTISATTNTKVYNGTKVASAVPTFSGLKVTDTVTGLTENYQSKDVLGANKSLLTIGTGYTVNDGNGGKDYTVVAKTATGTITPAALTITAGTNTKVYDGTTTASATPTVTGLFSGDTATALKEAYLSKDVKGTNGSTLQVTGNTINDGIGGKDYTVTLKTAAGTITGAGLTINATTMSKVYDGTVAATATPTVSGLKGTDTATGLVEAYSLKDVKGTNGSTLIVTGSTVVDGNNGQNYIVTLNSIPGTITPAILTIGATTNTKVFDGTTSAAAIPTVAGVLGGDTVTGLLEAYSSKFANGVNGSTLIVTGYSMNDGNNGNDYLVNLVAASGTITGVPVVRKPGAASVAAGSGVPASSGGTSQGVSYNPSGTNRANSETASDWFWESNDLE